MNIFKTGGLILIGGSVVGSLGYFSCNYVTQNFSITKVVASTAVDSIAKSITPVETPKDGTIQEVGLDKTNADYLNKPVGEKPANNTKIVSDVEPVAPVVAETPPITIPVNPAKSASVESFVKIIERRTNLAITAKTTKAVKAFRLKNGQIAYTLPGKSVILGDEKGCAIILDGTTKVYVVKADKTDPKPSPGCYGYITGRNGEKIKLVEKKF